MTHYTNTDNPIDFPKKKDIPMLEKFAAQSLVESDGELVFSKEKFAELIVRECIKVCENLVSDINSSTERWKVTGDFEIIHIGMAGGAEHCVTYIKEHFGVEE